jgi:hypothetical protein
LIKNTEGRKSHDTVPLCHEKKGTTSIRKSEIVLGDKEKGNQERESGVELSMGLMLPLPGHNARGQGPSRPISGGRGHSIAS